MPRGDRTGPNGMGPRTGRGAGFCSGFDRPGYMNGGAARGFGYGRGMGRGYGRGYGYGFATPYAPYAPVPYSKETERGYLENEISILKEQLKASEARLADIGDDE